MRGNLLLASIGIEIGSILISAGVRKLGPIIAERLDIPELRRTLEGLSPNKIKSILLEASGRQV